MTDPRLIALALFVCFTAVSVVLYSGFFARRAEIERRLADIALAARVAAGHQQDNLLSRNLIRWATARLPSPKDSKGRGEKLRQTLCYAGYPSAHALVYYRLLRLLLSLVLALIGATLALLLGKAFGAVVMWGAAGAMAGTAGPNFYLGRLATKRQKLIALELSDILDLLVVSIEAGLGIYQAIRTVGREAQAQGREMGRELSLLSGELAANSTLGQGMRMMAERTGVEEVRALAAILVQSEKLGSQMGPALRACSDSMRTKRRLKAEEAAQKSTIKMLLPMVLFVLPAMMAVMLGPAVVQIAHSFHH
ncbi:MAG TPA: type II secretion system F family protein [Candidatus Binataceae bacterium]|nr:type II secretion system F family protein [Candidatus Binataceae bacterium]